MTVLLTAWSWLAGSKLGRTVAAIATVVVVFIGALVMARGSGRRAAKAEQQQRDMERADDLREAADDARRRSRDDARSPDDRLRGHGRLR